LANGIFHLLIVIVYFSTNYTENNNQIFVRNSLTTVCILYLLELIKKFFIFFNSLRHFGKNLNEKEISQHIYLENDILFIIFNLALVFSETIAGAFLVYYFVPFSKTYMCNIYGLLYCNMIKAYCVFYLIFMPIINGLFFLGFLVHPENVSNKYIKIFLTFLRDNLLGLLFGNILNVVSIEFE